jgi:hypothetical protein
MASMNFPLRKNDTDSATEGPNGNGISRRFKDNETISAPWCPIGFEILKTFPVCL